MLKPLYKIFSEITRPSELKLLMEHPWNKIFQGCFENNQLSTHKICFCGENYQSMLIEKRAYLKLYVIKPCPAEPGYILPLQTV